MARTRTWSWALVAALAVTVTSAAAACGGGGDGGDGEGRADDPGGGGAVDLAGSDLPGSSGSSSSDGDDGSGAEPPATDVDAAFAVVERKVAESTELVDSLFQDPSLVADPDAPAVARLEELYSTESPVPDQLITELRSLADQRRRLRPAPTTGFFRDLGVYDLTVIDERSIGYYVCAVEDVEVVDAAGTVVDKRARVFQGNGAAVREDGVWRLVAMVPIEGFSRTLPPGVVNVDLCDSAADAAARSRPTGG